MDSVQGALMTAGSENATVIRLTDVDMNEKKTFHITIIAGTVKFGTTAALAAAGHGWTVGDTVPPFTCFNGELYFDAASAADTFVVSAF